jgi:hypothetical protein
MTTHVTFYQRSGDSTFWVSFRFTSCIIDQDNYKHETYIVVGTRNFKNIHRSPEKAKRSRLPKRRDQ